MFGMAKQLWYTFYTSIAIGVVIGIILLAGLNIDFNIITGALGRTISILQISPGYQLLFTIIAIICVIGCVVILIREASATYGYAGENTQYVVLCGIAGGFLLPFGKLGLVSIMGIIMLIIGVLITYHTEREPPGTPEHKR